MNKVINKQNIYSKFPDKFVDNNNKCFTSDKDIANGFNTFFVNIGPDLAKKITMSAEITVNDYVEERPNSMFISNVLEEEVINIVNKVKSKTSLDNDNINMKIVKEVITQIAKPFSFICNESFEEGIFPDNMKIAKVLPLYKNGEKHLFTNYRPVSLLSQFSKILEKLFAFRLDKFIDKYQILNDSQYGFRCKNSTSLALLELI